jgi:hypothetical protein
MSFGNKSLCYNEDNLVYSFHYFGLVDETTEVLLNIASRQDLHFSTWPTTEGSILRELLLCYPESGLKASSSCHLHYFLRYVCPQVVLECYYVAIGLLGLSHNL